MHGIVKKCLQLRKRARQGVNMELRLFLLYPERRNQLGANLTGSEGRAPEFTALMVSRFYTLLTPNSNTVTFGNSGNNLAGVLCATDRNSRGDAVSCGFKQEWLLPCSWIPATVNESKSRFKDYVRSVDLRDTRETYHSLVTGKAVEVLSPVTKYPPVCSWQH